MLADLREDFDRWWITADFREKVTMAALVTLTVLAVLRLAGAIVGTIARAAVTA